MTISSLFSSFLPVVHNDGPENPVSMGEEPQAEEKLTASAETDGVVRTEEEATEEEAEEPQDLHPAIKEECQNSQKCAPLTKHFQHCQEKVQSGQGFPHEDCVEELMMHCVDNCSAPKLFSKLC